MCSITSNYPLFQFNSPQKGSLSSRLSESRYASFVRCSVAATCGIPSLSSCSFGTMLASTAWVQSNLFIDIILTHSIFHQQICVLSPVVESRSTNLYCSNRVIYLFHLFIVYDHLPNSSIQMDMTFIIYWIWVYLCKKGAMLVSAHLEELGTW